MSYFKLNRESDGKIAVHTHTPRDHSPLANTPLMWVGVTIGAKLAQKKCDKTLFRDRFRLGASDACIEVYDCFGEKARKKEEDRGSKRA